MQLIIQVDAGLVDLLQLLKEVCLVYAVFGKKSSLSKYIFRLELYISIHRVSTHDSRK